MARVVGESATGIRGPLCPVSLADVIRASVAPACSSVFRVLRRAEFDRLVRYNVSCINYATLGQ